MGNSKFIYVGDGANRVLINAHQVLYVRSNGAGCEIVMVGGHALNLLDIPITKAQEILANAG